MRENRKNNRKIDKRKVKDAEYTTFPEDKDLTAGQDHGTQQNVRRRRKRRVEEAEAATSRIEDLFVPDTTKKIRTNRSMLHVGIILVALFIALIGYIVKFTVYDSPTVITNPYNRRTSNLVEKITRGEIKSANDKILAVTKKDDNGEEYRYYPYEDMFAHVVGYNTHGKSGLESAYNYELLKSHVNILRQFSDGAQEEKSQGDTLLTTLDTRLQKAAYEALGEHRGVVIAISPSTGKVRAMVSKPDFNPNDIADNWSDINDEGSSVLVNRAVQGLYPPGSTYKLMTALSYIEQNPRTYQDFHYNCDGEAIIDSVKIHCYNGEEHGKEDFTEAFAESCNTAFATIGSKLNLQEFRDLNDQCLFNRSIPFDLPVKKSQFVLDRKSSKSQVPQTAIGQGNTLMTPLHNALLISAVANDGILMKPELTEGIESFDGHKVSTTKPEKIGRLIDSNDNLALKKMLRKVVTEGTADDLDNDEYKVYGKTGTAENSGENAHAWFIGFSEKEEKADLSVCVLVENSGKASRYAVPIAKRMFESYYNNEMDKTYTNIENTN